MALPQTPEAAANAIDSMAAKQMGVPPQQPPLAAPAPKAKDSAEDKASAKGSPDTEGDKMSAEAIVYEIDMGDGNKRPLTEKQIQSTFQRYASLNHQHAQNGPINSLVSKIQKANPNATSKQIADKIDNMLKAQASNPTMGNTKGEKSGDAPQPEDRDAMLTKWEQDNAATLPPGYREMMTGTGQQGQSMAAMQAQLAQTQQMLQQVLAQSQGVADAAKTGVQQAEGTQIAAMQKQIANNVDRVQAHLQLGDDQAEPFMAFAAERGFTMEDFINPNLTLKVMSDFKNNMNSPEMERIKAIAQKRQAMTGSFGSTPSSGPAAEGPSTSRFDNFASKQMASKGIA